jgi:hypothetical protein
VIGTAEVRTPTSGCGAVNRLVNPADREQVSLAARFAVVSRSVQLLCGLALCALALPTLAGASALDDPVDQWLPSSDGGEWVYTWSDSQYSSAPETDRFVVKGRNGATFRLQWDQVDPPPDGTASSGFVDFQRTDAGLVNLNYQSTPPPAQFPILCASATSCGNSLASPAYMLIWGTRSPVLAAPLMKGTRWSALGGAANDVASDNRYTGTARVVVPAFPGGVIAARVESQITQAGALGDPYGSGVRTVYWVRGVGPVRITFRHIGGELTQADLQSTTLKALPLPSDENLLPLNLGDTMKYRWRNNRHMKKWSTQRFSVSQVVNNTARVDVKHVSGPIRVAGSYTFSTRLSGVTNLSAVTRAATAAKFPKLGPRGAARADRRHFFTPFDLMAYGLNPVLEAYPVTGDSWRSSRDSRDWKIYGVSATSTVLKAATVKAAGHTYKHVVGVRSKLRQKGYRFGSGTRTSWFSPGRGLVKLTFHHGDGSTSIVELVR